MSTPDPDRKSAPFEWRALTINKVEKIQLARLHEEQDRIERELREQEAIEREAHRVESQERERDAVEQEWFDAGTVQPRDTLDDVDTQRETAAFTPLKRLTYSLAALGRRLTNPPPKSRTSVPPPPLNDSPISLSLVLAACAFGGSVYLSLRWVAEVRQANVTQQLSSSVNATTPASNLDANPRGDVATPAAKLAPIVTSPAVAAPPPIVTAPSDPAAVEPTPTAVAPALVQSNSQPAPPVAGLGASPLRAAVLPVNGSRSAVPASMQPGQQPPQEVAATLPGSAELPAQSESAELPSTASQTTVRSRVLVPASGSPHSSGTRVYRGGE
jgi:hypothetical protein